MPTSFLSLPPEIRNTIYNLSLISHSSGPIGPYVSAPSLPNCDSDSDKENIPPASTSQNVATTETDTIADTTDDLKQIHPDIAPSLLQTCKSIRQEVRPIFYGLNLWHFDAGTILTHKDTVSYTITEPFKSNLRFFRKLRVRFSTDDLRSVDGEKLTEKNCKAVGLQTGYRMSAVETAEKRRLKYDAIVTATWAKMVQVLKRMPLETLEIEILGCDQLQRDRLMGNRALLPRFTTPGLGKAKWARKWVDDLYDCANQDTLDRIVAPNVMDQRHSNFVEVILRTVKPNGLLDIISVHEPHRRYGFRCRYCLNLTTSESASLLGEDVYPRACSLNEYGQHPWHDCPAFRNVTGTWMIRNLPMPEMIAGAKSWDSQIYHQLARRNFGHGW